jgi:1-acyl-sn-glycerol-3-phosphate acyltransferase
MNTRPQISELRNSLTDDLMRLLGIPKRGLPRLFVNPFLVPPATMFSRLADRFDQTVEQFGLREACHWALSKFAQEADIKGWESIPSEGPLLIAANHPGTIDGLAIASYIPRPDLKVVITGIPFFQKLRSTANHLIYASSDPHERMTTIRSIIRQLESGGSLLIFPTGTVDPDPDIMPGAHESLEQWSPSLDLILRKVPQTQVLVTIVSGVLKPSYLRNPLAKLHKGIRERQKVAEFLQVAQQLLFPKSLSLLPRITFAPPISVLQLQAIEGSKSLLKSVIDKAQQLLAEHTSYKFQQEKTG